MRRFSVFAFATAFAAALPAPAAPTPGASAADAAFLFELLQEKPYRAAWDRLMTAVQPTPDWLLQFNRNYDGMSGAVTRASLAGKDYQLSYVCEPKDCAGHRFVVAFAASDKPQAFGALGGKDNSPEFFGSPPQDLQDAMNKALGRIQPTAAQ